MPLPPSLVRVQKGWGRLLPRLNTAAHLLRMPGRLHLLNNVTLRHRRYITLPSALPSVSPLCLHFAATLITLLARLTACDTTLQHTMRADSAMLPRSLFAIRFSKRHGAGTSAHCYTYMRCVNGAHRSHSPCALSLIKLGFHIIAYTVLRVTHSRGTAFSSRI